MKAYTLELRQDGKKFIWCVIETANDLTVARYVFEEDAQKHLKHLLSGGGFNGFSPGFLFRNTSNIKTEYAINSAHRV